MNKAARRRRRNAIRKEEAQRRAREADASASPKEEGFEDHQASRTVLRVELMRRVMDIRRAFRLCPHALCRRARRCAGADFACSSRLPRRDVTPEQESRAIALLHRGLQRRMKQIERNKGARQ